MHANRYLVALLCLATAFATLCCWGIAFGSALALPIPASSALIASLAEWFDGYAALQPAHGWARFYVAVGLIMAPMPVLVGLAALKGWLLPRNVSITDAWKMELRRLGRNMWLLLTKLDGNFR